MIEQLAQSLTRNQGAVLTPELIQGVLVIAYNSQPVPVPAPPPEPLHARMSGAVLREDEAGRYEMRPVPMAAFGKELGEQHRMQWDETEGYRADAPLCPDYDSMLASEAAGGYVVFALLRNGSLIGNCGVYIFRSLHTGELTASEDTIFVLPEYRGNGLADLFMDAIEAQLRAIGVAEMRIKVKTMNGAAAFFERKGFTLTGYELTKR